ncbi:MAG: HNH endonuclease [Culicoidibacterales bacterium]
MKICKCCGLKLPFNNFTKSKNVKDGYENKCKKCRNEQKLKYLCKCVTCGREWNAQSKNSKYCTPNCKPQSSRKRYVVKCSICGEEKEVTKYRINHQKDFYCSDECKNKGYSLKYSGENSARYSKVDITCPVCGKNFKRNPYETSRYQVNYCSLECKKTDYKIRFAGENNPLFGKSRDGMKGELNPAWNPNRTHEQRKKERKLSINTNWTKEVLHSQNYTCQCCGKVGGDLVAHHIDGYNWCEEKRTDVNNGATLCVECHKNFHSTYGYGDNNKKQYKEFIKVHGNTEPSLDRNILEGVETR